MKTIKKIMAVSLVVALAASALAPAASAKTISSEKAENIFFYATDADGKSVLIDTLTLGELKSISHGQSGGNYFVSATDNYPTTQYLEARGFTLSELVEYIKSDSSVAGAGSLTFSGEDNMRFMATDSYGNYSRSWTYDELYGEKRYYFEGLYADDTGWNTGWEIAGEDNSKYGVSLDDYNALYRDSDPYYENKRAAFEGGVETCVILATESYSGRTTSSTLVASTEPGIAPYIESNGGVVTGCLANVVTDEHALRLCIPMTEADLMAAHRTAYDNFKWIYNMQLDMDGLSAVRSLGTVAEPVPSFSLNGSTLTVSLSCETAGAAIYYGFEGAAQTLYTGPFTVDVSDRDVSTDPVTVYAAAVKEGWDDAGMLTFKYPGTAPAFKTLYSAMTGNALIFTAADGVSSTEWQTWTGALNFISIKTPSVNGYVTLDDSKYSIDNTAKTITFDASLFTDTGSYSFIFHNTKYANKNVSVTMKMAAPELSAAESYVFGEPLTISFDSDNYQSGLSVYVTAEGGKRTLISSSYIDRTVAGQVTIKADYFTLSSSVMSKGGAYTIELVNNSFSPASQTVAVTVNTAFTDVLPGQWYYAYVTELANAGIINGMGDGTFAPKGTLTWGQALKLLMLSTGYAEQSPTDKHWASGYINTALADGLISESVEPNGEISRLQFCRAAAKALGAETTLSASPFTDTDDPAVLALYEKGIINGMTETSFEPDGTLTRGQISKIIWCIMNLEDAE